MKLSLFFVRTFLPSILCVCPSLYTDSETPVQRISIPKTNDMTNRTYLFMFLKEVFKILKQMERKVKQLHTIYLLSASCSFILFVTPSNFPSKNGNLFSNWIVGVRSIVPESLYPSLRKIRISFDTVWDNVKLFFSLSHLEGFFSVNQARSRSSSSLILFDVISILILK